MSPNETFQFFPRPEAMAMQWNQLVQPVKSAVRDLLVILSGAVRQSHSKDKNLEVASCFLVNGERGTGKTSVLLNAREAVEDHERFFIHENSLAELANRPSNAQEADALDCAKQIKEHAVWLDILDLEPLQAETNLLTTVLTRIRKALTQFDGQDGEQEITSLFEASRDSARPLLERLIGDATLMWENIKEQDTRNIANRQVAAAGIYAEFKELFKKAIDKLTEELGRPYGKDVRRAIILPIDNIDRSTEHLYNIVKLAQLVSHPHLWLVMAGGREDITTFLERAYWKELIHNSNILSISGALGRNESNGEDESLTMARRQAAATAQKIWPSSHRVVVAFMQPENTLAFAPPSQHKLETIEDLLCKVNIPTWLKNEDKLIQFPFFGLFEHIGVPFDISDLKNNESKTSLIKRMKELESTEIHSLIRKHKLGDILTKVDKFSRKNTHSKEESDKIAASIIDALNKILVKEDKPIYGNSSQDKVIGVSLRDWVKGECAKHDDSKESQWVVRFLNKAILQDVFSNVFSRPLTLAAKNGLKMPIRSLLELWQTAYWVVHDETYFDNYSHDKAEQIIRTMLRNAIAESSLSSHISRGLQENVIRKCVNGGTLLNFRELKLDIECVAPNDTEIRIKEPKKPLKNYIQSCIRIKRGNESFLRFKLKEESNRKEFEEELPEFVAAWLSILYDVLALAERLAIISGVSIPPPKMAARHSVVMNLGEAGKEKRFATIEEELQWPVPAWGTFRAQGLFWRRWTNFQLKVEQEWQDYRDNIENNIVDVKPNEAQSGGNPATAGNNCLDISELLSRYLVIGWVRCVLDTYADMHWYSRCDVDKQEKWLSRILENLPHLNWPNGIDDITKLGTLVLVQAAVVHWCLSNCMDKPLHRRNHFDIQEMLDWLEIELPMFFSHWYMPIDNSERSKPRFESYTTILEHPDELKKRLESLQDREFALEGEIEKKLLEATKELAKSWKEKLPFIVAKREDRIAELFKPKEDMTNHDRAFRQKEHQYFLQEINELCSLHKYLKDNFPHWKDCKGGIDLGES